MKKANVKIEAFKMKSIWYQIFRTEHLREVSYEME